MVEWGRLLVKYAAFEDLFELEEIAQRLRDTTDWDYHTATLGQYLKGRRKPPPGFFDYVQTALNLDEDNYNLLLYTFHGSQKRLSPHQQGQRERFRQMLYDRMTEQIVGEGKAGGAVN